MHLQFKNIAYTDSVKDVQRSFGSNEAELEKADDKTVCALSSYEKEFIGQLDGFYIASTNQDAWPYIQFRGGPPGFVKIVNDELLAFADFRGNRQYISSGNIKQNPRVCLFFMDYAKRRRLKMFALAQWIKIEEACDELKELISAPDYRALVERVMLLEVQAFDWNCPQHITPRFSAEQWAANTLLKNSP